MSFADDTRIERTGQTTFSARLDERWTSLVGIHGGYSAAILARGIEAAVDDSNRCLRTIAVQFAAPPEPGPAQVDVRIERAGRSITTTSARMFQGDRLLLVAHAVSSPAWPGLDYNDLARPERPEPGDLPRFTPPMDVHHFHNAEVRLDPRAVPFSAAPEAWIAAWVRPVGGERIDAPWIVAMCDVLPPAVFSRTTGPVKASLEYVVHLATGKPELPSGEHAYLECRSPYSNEGFAVEDATLWGPGGDVLAVARQTRLAGG
jgi:acyl-CoA thioesterase